MHYIVEHRQQRVQLLRKLNIFSHQINLESFLSVKHSKSVIFFLCVLVPQFVRDGNSLNNIVSSMLLM